MVDERRRLDEYDDEYDNDDGSRGIWAAFEREASRPLSEHTEVNVDTLKERLKHRARLRAGRSEDDPE
jgi:hypothetical protein